MSERRPARVVNSSAPIRVCDNGGWTDTWFARRGVDFDGLPGQGEMGDPVGLAAYGARVSNSVHGAKYARETHRNHGHLK